MAKSKEEIAKEIKQDANQANNSEELLQVIQKAKKEIKDYEEQ